MLALFFGVPNALLGCAYFPLLAAGLWILPSLAAAGHSGAASLVTWLLLIGVAMAAATSAFLAYSLLFVTKRACPYCWTSHAVDAALLLLVPVCVLR